MLNRISSTAALVVFALLMTLVPVSESWAQRRGMSLVRDAEIEHTIRRLSAPLFEAAGLSTESVSIYLVNDRALNAFVAGGQRVFLNTGLLLRTEDPGQLIGVIAHETGHISGGHLARLEDAMRGAYIQTLLSMVLGAAAAAAGGGGDAGAAIIMGGQQMAERSLLSFTRTQEAAADQAALALLERTAQSGRGLVEFLEILGDQEVLLSERQDPYARTHPISRERLSALRTRVQQSPYYHRQPSPEAVAMHERMRAKLAGFLEPLTVAMRKYPESDTSLQARYARAIAWYRVPQLDKALAEIDALLADYPADPYFLELKGQMLFENGRVAAAVPAYEAAVEAMPHEPLFRYALGQAQLATEDDALLNGAVANLEFAVRADPEHTGVWHQLAIGYGRQGNLGMAHLASAERAMLQNRFLDARQQAERALGRLPTGSPGALRAEDLISAASKEEQRRQP